MLITKQMFYSVLTIRIAAEEWSVFLSVINVSEFVKLKVNMWVIL